MKRRDVLGLALLSAAAFAMCGWNVALAQNTYPDHPVRLIVPYAAGSATDLHGRLLVPRISPILGQSIVIEDKPGASGIIGTAAVVHAKPDGYTLLLGTSSTLVIAPATVKEPPYEVMKDLITIAIIGVQPIMLVATPGLPVKNLREFVDLIKASPGKYTYGTSSDLSVNELMMKRLKKQAGNLNLIPVNYSGGTNEVARDLLGGHLHLAALAASGALPLYHGGKLRVLAVSAATRLRSAPDIPTFVESGLPDVVVLTFNAISVPAGTPKPIVDRLSQTMAKVMAADDYVKDLDKLGMDLLPGGSSTENATKFLNDFIGKFTPDIKEHRALTGG